MYNVRRDKIGGGHMQNNAMKKNISLDIIRILAILAVVMLHMSGIFILSYDMDTPEYLAGNVFDSFNTSLT